MREAAFHARHARLGSIVSGVNICHQVYAPFARTEASSRVCDIKVGACAPRDHLTRAMPLSQWTPLALNDFYESPPTAGRPMTGIPLLRHNSDLIREKGEGLNVIYYQLDGG